MRVDELISRMLKEYGVMPKGFMRVDFMNPDAEIYPVTHLTLQRNSTPDGFPSYEFKYEVEAIFKQAEISNFKYGQLLEVWEIGHVNHTDETRINMKYGQFHMFKADWLKKDETFIHFALESDMGERGLVPGEMDR